jgi:hypothetical protein
MAAACPGMLELLAFLFLLMAGGVSSTVADPIALHQLVSVPAGQDAVIRLKSYDTSGSQLQYEIRSLPATGSLYQLSQVYSEYGYEPKAGTLITSVPTLVTGSNNRIYYRRPDVDRENELMWSNFSFAVIRDTKTSYAGIVSLIAPSGIFTSSTFLMESDGWTIDGNKVQGAPVVYEPYNSGKLSYYIYGEDDKINTAVSGAADTSLWYFQAPEKFTGNLGNSYGGNLQFTLGSFSGDFSKQNGVGTSLAILECDECNGSLRKGIKLVFPISASATAKSFDGKTTEFSIPLLEGAGWLKDPQNALSKWTTPSQCDMIQVLSRLSSMRILGDWTTWYESVAMDDVKITNLKGQLPYCSQLRPDASLCDCAVVINAYTGYPH